MTVEWVQAIVDLHAARQTIEAAQGLIPPETTAYVRLGGLLDDIADVADLIEDTFGGPGQ